MKSRNTILSFIGGLMVGIFLALTFGTSGQGQAPTVPAKDWSHVTVVSYPSGVTGFFDQSTGRLYLYDAYWENCIGIRELDTLGNPMRRLR